MMNLKNLLALTLCAAVASRLSAAESIEAVFYRDVNRLAVSRNTNRIGGSRSTFG